MLTAGTTSPVGALVGTTETTEPSFARCSVRTSVPEHVVPSTFTVNVQRTSARDTRPLLQTANPRATIERLMAERRPYYSQADIHVTSTNVAHREVVGWIVEAIEKFLAR